MSGLGRLAAVLAGGMLLCSLASADELLLKDGRRFQGRLVRKGDKEVVFEALRAGMNITLTLPAADVLKIIEGPVQSASLPSSGEAKPTAASKAAASRPAADGKPKYYVVEINGQIGLQTTASLLEGCLKEATAHACEALVLEIDSPGGAIDQAEQIVRLIQNHPAKRKIAHVKRAISAAAVIALTCREIYIEPGATMGDALAIQSFGWGQYNTAPEKVQSVWRATARSAAEAGGHSTLLADAMIDDQLELRLETQDGQNVVKEGQGPKMIKRRGRLMTLTAKEAVDYGIAKAVVKADEFIKTAGLDEMIEDLAGRKKCKLHQAQVDKASKELADLNQRFRQTLQEAQAALSPQQAVEKLSAAIAIINKAKEIYTKHPEFGVSPDVMTGIATDLAGQRQMLMRRR